MSDSRCEGWLLAGRYRLLAEVGRGGMGRVWRAHDELLDREVAIKEVVLAGSPALQHEVLVARTMREARMAARLSHPNIAAVYDVVPADGRPWIVMQLVRAPSLAQVIAERGPLPVSAVVRIGLEVLAALRAAHACGVVHRDVKPANILVTGDRHAIVTDFGLATRVDDEAQLTQANLVVGTPAYIAPERVKGGPTMPPADLWSLGATLYAAVEGRAPFVHSSEMATLAAVLTSGPAPFRRAGPLAPIIAGLLEKDPARRTDAASAEEQLLRVSALSGQGPEATGAQAAVRPDPTAPARGLAVHDGGLRAGGRPCGGLGRRPAHGRRTPRPVPGPPAAHWRRTAAVTAAGLIVSALAAAWAVSGSGGAGPMGSAESDSRSAQRTASVMQAVPVVEERRAAPSTRDHRGDARPAPVPVAATDAGTSSKPATKAEPKKAESKKGKLKHGNGHGHKR